MPRSYENPLSGEPATVQTEDAEGRPVFTVAARELTPGRAKLATLLSGVAGLCLVPAVPYALLQWSHIDFIHGVVVVTAAVACHRTVKAAIRQALHRTTDIVLSVADIAVRRRTGWKHYARDVTHQFVLIPHDLTQAEQRENAQRLQQASLDRKAFQPPVFFGESFHVALAYAGQRVDLLTVYGPPRAAAVVARLQLCDELLNRAAGKSHTTGGGPGEDWGRPAPGGLA
jgi:hypothetical protein